MSVELPAANGTATRFYFIRHGEVEARYQRVFGGRLDIGLSHTGEAQARQLAESLSHFHFDAVYVSPMQRARRTLQPLLATNGYQPVILDGLREVDFGAWTGHSWEEVGARFGKRAADWLLELETGGIPDAEPVSAWRARVADCLARMAADHPGGAIAVVSHGGVIRMALACLLDLPTPKLAHFEIDYASLTVVHLTAGRAEVKLLNWTPWRHSF